MNQAVSAVDITRLTNADLAKKFQELSAQGLLNYQNHEFKKWLWRYVENPNSLSLELPSWLAVLDGEIIGYLGAIPVKLKVNSRIINAAWAVDFMASSKHRRKGIGRLLVEEANKNYDMFLTVGQTDASFNLFIKMGWRHLGDLPYFIRIMDLKSVMQNETNNKLLAYLVFFLPGIFIKAYNYSRRPKKSKKIQISTVKELAADKVDSFWNEISNSYGVAVSRDNAYINWKYAKQPDMNYVKFQALSEGNVCGYLFARSINNGSSSPEGLITDIMVDPGNADAINSLLSAALSFFSQEKCGLVRCYANHESIKKILLSLGFIRRKVKMRFLINKNIAGLEDADLMANWHLTAGDCDIDR